MVIVLTPPKKKHATRDCQYLSDGLYPGNKHLDTAQFVKYLESKTFVFVGRVGVNGVVDVNRY